MKDFFGNLIMLVLAGVGFWAMFFWHPDHAQRIGFFKYKADPGYGFVDNAWIPAVRWTPGVAFSQQGHVVAADQEGSWQPSAGYYWSNSDGREPRGVEALVDVAWSPGSIHPAHPNVIASRMEGNWHPASGYGWVDGSAEQLLVEWVPGTRDRDRKHYIAGATEGSWVLEAGYQIAGGTFLKFARWTPGLSHPDNQCLVSDETEGRWHPVPNHHISRDDGGQIRILADSADPDWGSALGKLAIGFVMHSASQSEEDDSAPTWAAKKVGEKLAGEAAISGLKDIFDPSGNDPCDNVLLGKNWG